MNKEDLKKEIDEMIKLRELWARNLEITSIELKALESAYAE